MDLYLFEHQWCEQMFMAHGYKMQILPTAVNTSEEHKTALEVRFRK
jgi:hypothetical protein